MYRSLITSLALLLGSVSTLSADPSYGWRGALGGSIAFDRGYYDILTHKRMRETPISGYLSLERICPCSWYLYTEVEALHATGKLYSKCTVPKSVFNSTNDIPLYWDGGKTTLNAFSAKIRGGYTFALNNTTVLIPYIGLGGSIAEFNRDDEGYFTKIPDDTTTRLFAGLKTETRIASAILLGIDVEYRYELSENNHDSVTIQLPFTVECGRWCVDALRFTPFGTRDWTDIADLTSAGIRVEVVSYLF